MHGGSREAVQARASRRGDRARDQRARRGAAAAAPRAGRAEALVYQDFVGRRERFAPTAPSFLPSTPVWLARLSPEPFRAAGSWSHRATALVRAAAMRALATRTYSSLMSKPMHRRF